jgi:hypothetical protein
VLPGHSIRTLAREVSWSLSSRGRHQGENPLESSKFYPVLLSNLSPISVPWGRLPPLSHRHPPANRRGILIYICSRYLGQDKLESSKLYSIIFPSLSPVLRPLLCLDHRYTDRKPLRTGGAIFMESLAFIGE